MSNRPWPEAVDQLVGDDAPEIRRAWNRWTVGSATVLRLEDTHRGPQVQAERLQRIGSAARFAVPEVRGFDGPWLVTVGPDGIRADEPQHHTQPGTLAGLVGEGLAALHRLTPSLISDGAGPGPGEDRGLVDRCRRAVTAGLVDPSTLPSPYDRYDPARLLDLLVEGRPVVDEPPVLCHGGPDLDRCLIDGARFVGFDGFESAVVADRHLDLAVAHLGVARTLGTEAVFAFYEGYGTDPDLVRLDHHVLAAHLLGHHGRPDRDVGAPIR